jgi:fumarate reductase (CoM/CoB) subunit B
MKLDAGLINRCVRCGTCRSVCPVFEESGYESANTRGRILVMKGLQEGLKPDLDVLDSLNTCTTCGICTDNCPSGVNPPEMVETARRELVLQGAMTVQQANLFSNISSSGNTFGDTRRRHTWLQDRSRLKDRADFVYFVGCMNSYRYQETAANTFDILQRFGATLLPAEQCCGSPLLRTGFDAGRLIEANMEQIDRIGAHTIITGCAGCYTTLKKSYPSDLKIASVPEFLAEHIDCLDHRHLDLTVTYHDPCHLGRHNQIYAQPRKVIEAICSLSEMKVNRQNARCCGGGGGVRLGYKDLSLKMARKRLCDVPDSADFIVTSCPLCVRNLRDAGGDEKVIDLVDLVAKSIN